MDTFEMIRKHLLLKEERKIRHILIDFVLQKCIVGLILKVIVISCCIW